MKLTYKAVTVRAEGPSRKEAMDACALRMLKEVGHFIPRKVDFVLLTRLSRMRAVLVDPDLTPFRKLNYLCKFCNFLFEMVYFRKSFKGTVA